MQLELPDGTIHELPDNLYWSDEYDRFEPVAQHRERALDGTLHIQEAPRRAGRPITLRGAWIERSGLASLRQASEETGDMTLTLDDGREFDVRWRRERRRPAVEGEPVYPLTAPPDDHYYELTLRFITV